jgi:hypothetical protein
MVISWVCGSGPWPSESVRACREWYGSGGLGGACWVGVGFGEAAEGDLEAECAEFADVVGDLAADVALAFVVVRAEVDVGLPFALEGLLVGTLPEMRTAGNAATV